MHDEVAVSKTCHTLGCRNRSRPRRLSPSRRASSPVSYRQRDMLRRDSKRSPPRRSSRRSPSPPTPPRRRSSRERRSDRVRPASRERASGKKAVVEDKGKSKKDSKDKDSDRSKNKSSIKKVEPAKVSAKVSIVQHLCMPVVQCSSNLGLGYSYEYCIVGTMQHPLAPSWALAPVCKPHKFAHLGFAHLLFILMSLMLYCCIVLHLPHCLGS